jgi:hypothetical protein
MEKKHHSTRIETDAACANAVADPNKKTVTLDAAQAWITKWMKLYADNVLKKTDPPTPPTNDTVLRSFFIPPIDLTSITSVENYAGARAYLAVNDNNQLTLLLVPVVNPPESRANELSEPQSQDMLCKSVSPLLVPESTIYDFTMPCPMQCGNGAEISALYVPIPTDI